MTEPDFAAMAAELSMLHDEEKYEAFLRRQSLKGDHSFLLAAIERSNLRTSVSKVLRELITRKLRRPNHRPTSEDVHIKGMYRALCVLDLEAAGWNKRDAAIEEARGKLGGLSYSTIEKAVSKYEGLIQDIRDKNPGFLDYIRSAFK
jgi:hypothetical protein